MIKFIEFIHFETLNILECTGRIQEFHYNLANLNEDIPSGNYMNLPLTHPLRLAYHIGYCLDFLIVSACYGAIYRLNYKSHQTPYKKLHFHRFIKYQDDNVSGLTEAARKVRRTKNLVSMKFNLLNFLMETLSVLLLLAIKSYFIRILYLLVRYIYLYLRPKK